MDNAIRGTYTEGLQIYYPHGVIIQQPLMSNYYRGENRVNPGSVPTLLRLLDDYDTKEKKNFTDL